jgi:hypothetical protein
MCYSRCSSSVEVVDCQVVIEFEKDLHVVLFVSLMSTFEDELLR